MDTRRAPFSSFPSFLLFSIIFCILIPPPTVTAAEDQPVDRPIVVVIGAGAAGLAAAQRLLDLGKFQVVLLEASDRIGGRIWTVPANNNSVTNNNVELGAEWLQGADNEFSDWAAQHGYISAVKPTKETQFLLQQNANGLKKEEKDAIFATLMQTDMSDYSTLTQFRRAEFTNSSIYPRDISYGNILWRKYINWRRRSVAANISDTVYDYVVRKSQADSAADSLFGLAATSGSQQQSLSLNISFTDLLRNFAPNASSVVLTNMWVTAISLDKASIGHPLRIGTRNGVTFSADHVIVTVSLGHMKANMPTLFDPPLSQRKQNTIQAAGFGTIAKIVLVYEDAWWRRLSLPDTTRWAFLLDRRLNKINTETWMRALPGFQQTESIPNSLTFLFGGVQAGEQLDNLQDAQISTNITQMLQTFFTNITVPLPTTIFRAKWKTNPLFAGTHSYHSTEFPQKNLTFADLAAPDQAFGYQMSLKGKMRLVPGLLFAGEATHPTLFGTVQGAVLSGVREANRLSILYS